MIVRPMQAEQAEACAAIHAASFDPGWPAEDFAAYVDSPTHLALVSEAHGEPTGCLIAQLIGEEAEILTLAVAPEHRRAGWGRALVLIGAELLAARGVHRLILDVREDNTPAIGLYHSLGFAEFSRRKGYYATAGGPRDAVLMESRLVPDA